MLAIRWCGAVLINIPDFRPQEVEDIVAFAGERGIRVIPEVDLPGHSAGFYPLEGPDGVQFCSNRTASMLP